MRHQLATFLLDGMLFGLEVEKVQEVIRHQRTTPVPLAPPEVEGLLNLRGQIVTAIDLRRRLELDPRSEDASPMSIVLHGTASPVAFVVDQIGEVEEVTDDDFEDPPETLRGAARDLIRGAYKLPEGLLLVLATERVLTISSSVTEN